MLTHKKPAGHILFIVLVVVSLLGLFVHNITSTILIEYKRIFNLFREQKLWLQLEFEADVFIALLATGKITLQDNRVVGFVPDTLELGCKTGMVLYSYKLSINNSLPMLILTYSMRK